MQNSLYFSNPDLTDCESAILQTERTSEGIELALADNIARPAGGGEPSDRGILRFQGQEFAFASASKRNGLTWLQIPQTGVMPAVNDIVRVQLDANYRTRRRRLHTGVHIVIRSFLAIVDIEVKSADIDEDAGSATISAAVAQPIDDQLFQDVTCRVNDVVVSAMPVTALKAKSVEEARRQYGTQFRMSDRHALNGKVRLIKIGDFDVNPCAGLHWNDTAIGPCRLGYTPTPAGFQATLRLVGTDWQ